MSDDKTGQLFEDANEGDGETSDGHAPDVGATLQSTRVRSAPDPSRMRRPTIRTGAPVRTVVRAPVSSGPLHPWGAVPPKADAWGVLKKNARDVFEQVGFVSPGAALESRVWPISELGDGSIVAARWGGGEYQIRWFSGKPNGGRRFLSDSHVFAVPAASAPVVEAPAAPVAAMPGLPPELAQTLLMMQTLDSLATGKLTQLAKMGEVLGGGRTNETSMMMQMLMQQQQAQAAMLEKLMAEQRADRDAQFKVLRELVTNGGGGGDDEEEGSAAGKVAGAVAKAAIDPDATFVDGLRHAFMTEPVEAMKTLRELAAQVPALATAFKDFTKQAAPPPPPSPPAAPLPPAPPAQVAPPRRVQRAPSANGAGPVSGRELAQREASSSPPPGSSSAPPS